MKPRAPFAALVVLLGLAAPVNAGPFEDGIEANKRGDYATALQLWRPLAEKGDAGAQFNLGFMYANGRGVTRDYAEAVKWYRLAAAQGDAQAQGNLGIMYGEGQGVAQDYAEAVKWWRLAATQGNASAQANLGLIMSGFLAVHPCDGRHFARGFNGLMVSWITAPGVGFDQYGDMKSGQDGPLNP